MGAPTERLMTSREVAAYLKVSEATISRWRTFKSGPDFVNLNGIPRYRLVDLAAWLEQKKVTA